MVDGPWEMCQRCACCHRISVKTLTDKTNVPLLAGEIVEKCKLIHPSKVRAGPGACVHAEGDAQCCQRWETSCAQESLACM